MWLVFYKYDAGLTQYVNSFSKQNFFIDEIVMFITSMGVPLMVLAVAGQWWSRSNRSQIRHVLLTAGFSFLLALALNQIILLFVQRVRPFYMGVTNLLGSPSIDPSFPSDHASAAFAIAFAFLFCSRTRQGIIFTTSAAAVALSRVYVGTHYVGDIIGGIITACAAAIVVRTSFRYDSPLNLKLIRLF